jgi:hypothetical protein
VPLASVQDAAERLFEQGVLTIDVATIGYRSAFIGAALSALPGTRASTNPRRIVLVDQAWPPASR